MGEACLALGELRQPCSVLLGRADPGVHGREEVVQEYEEVVERGRSERPEREIDPDHHDQERKEPTEASHRPPSPIRVRSCQTIAVTGAKAPIRLSALVSPDQRVLRGEMQKPPLFDVRELEVGNYMAAPFCGMQLADLGAEVIKIEQPDGGDQVRLAGPFVQGHSSPFVRLNRNKRSLVVDLKAPEGKEIFRKLVPTADVLIENLRP